MLEETCATAAYITVNSNTISVQPTDLVGIFLELL